MNPRWLVATVLVIVAAGCAVRRGVEPVGPSFQLSGDQSAVSLAAAHFAYGLMLEATKDSAPEDALAAFERAARFDPDSRRIRNALVMSLLRLGRREEALARVREAAEGSDAPLNWLDLARMAESMRRYADAEAAYARVEALDPDVFMEARLARVRCLFALEDDGRALELLVAMRERTPDEKVLSLLLYWGRHFLGSHPLRADACVERALMFAGSDAVRAELLGLRGDIHLSLDRTGDAMAFYREALRTDPAQATPALRLADQLREDDLPAALAALQTALEHNPEHLGLLAALGGLYQAAGRREAAATIFGRLYAQLMSRPELPAREFFAFYGGLLLELDRRAEAEAVYRAGVAAYPADALLLNNLAYTLAEDNRELDTAYGFARRAIELTPDHPAYLDTLGWIYYRRAQYEQALHYLLAALDKMPDDPVVREHVGDALAALNRIPEALIHWRESYRLKPNADVADRLIRHGISPTFFPEPTLADPAPDWRLLGPAQHPAPDP